MMKKLLKKFLPKSLILLYHKILAVLANLIYRFPSRYLTVIGVTGTNGKTTTCNIIWQILTEAGYKVGLTTSINFKIGKKELVNRTKQGMQGRFRLQKFLRQMVRAGCQYAVIETTSEGIKQYRHRGIDYNVAVFTNLTPEHIEAHGSFENYKQAKGELFRVLNCKRQRRFFAGAQNDIKNASIVNLDDGHAEYFARFPAKEKLGYGIKYQISNIKYQINSKIQISNIKKLSAQGTEFTVKINNQFYDLKTNLLGEFNIYNCLAGIAVGLSQGIKIEVMQNALAKMEPVPGRMEIIYDKKRNITVVVDYAHDPAALENVYETISNIKYQISNLHLKSQNFEISEKSKIIAVLGAVGGGRDKAKRPKLGALASKYAQYVIITNEDPYDDDPMEIINQVEKGVKDDPNRKINKNYWKISDRRQAIKKAVDLAKPNDIIALTGKGCEEVMATHDGFVSWDDRKVVREILG